MNELERTQKKENDIKNILEKNLENLTLDDQKIILLILEEHVKVTLTNDLYKLKNYQQYGLEENSSEFQRTISKINLISSILDKDLNNLNDFEKETILNILKEKRNLIQNEIVMLKNNQEIYNEIFDIKSK